MEEWGRLAVFQALEARTLRRLEEAATLSRHARGGHVFRDKEMVRRIYFVVRGKVALYTISGTGRKRVFFILDRGKMINEMLFPDLPASVSCEAFEDATVVGFGKDVLLALMQTDAALQKAVLHETAVKVRRMYRQLKNSASTLKAEKKVAAKLWKLCRDYGKTTASGRLIDLKISNAYLADLLSIQRETASRALKTLCDERLITYRDKKICVCDPDQLAAFFKRP